LQHLSEHTIELFIRDKDLNSSVLQQVKTHLSACTECRHIYKWLKEFYEELDVLNLKHHEWNGSRAFKKDTFKLEPFNHVSNTPGEQSPYVVLAAQSSSTKHRFEHIVTLHSREKRVLVRILYDHESGRYQLYLIMHHNRRQYLVLLTLPYHQKELVTSENGRVDFTMKRKPDSVQWDNMRGILRIPLSYCRITSNEIKTLFTRGVFTKKMEAFTFYLTYLSRENKVKVEVQETNSSFLSRLLLRDTKGENMVLSLDQNKTRLPSSRINISDTYTLAVYE
jgi:hypothetical protein